MDGIIHPYQLNDDDSDYRNTHQSDQSGDYLFVHRIKDNH
jgi:hypothetical protein